MTSKFKVKSKTPASKPSKAIGRIRQSQGRASEDLKEDLNGVVGARRESTLKERSANVELTTAMARSGRSQINAEYYDENGEEITEEQLHTLQDTVASFYQNFVVLTDDQIKDLQSKLPKKINNSNVKCGHKAVFPPILDTERKKVSRGRIIEKANRLRYIESETTRGLKMPDDVEKLLDSDKKSKRYEASRQAKKDLVRTLIALNYNDYEMCEYLQITGKELAKFKKEVFFEELTVHRQMSNEELYVQYKLQQMEIVKDLDVIIERFKGSKQLTALAAAMRTKSDIYNEIISKGYEFGVIEKTAEKSISLIGNVDIGTATMTELKSQLNKTNREIEKVVNSKNFLIDKENTIAIDVGEVD